MADKGTHGPTNERILQLLQEVQAELAQIARDVQRLLYRK